MTLLGHCPPLGTVLPNVPTCVPEDNRRSAFERKEPLAGCVTFPSDTASGFPEVENFPFAVVLVDDVVL